MEVLYTLKYIISAFIKSNPVVIKNMFLIPKYAPICPPKIAPKNVPKYWKDILTPKTLAVTSFLVALFIIELIPGTIPAVAKPNIIRRIVNSKALLTKAWGKYIIAENIRDTKIIFFVPILSESFPRAGA